MMTSRITFLAPVAFIETVAIAYLLTQFDVEFELETFLAAALLSTVRVLFALLLLKFLPESDINRGLAKLTEQVTKQGPRAALLGGLITAVLDSITIICMTLLGKVIGLPEGVFVLLFIFGILGISVMIPNLVIHYLCVASQKR